MLLSLFFFSLFFFEIFRLGQEWRSYPPCVPCAKIWVNFMFILVFFEYFFLRFSGVFSCDFRFVTFTQPFRDFLHGSVSPRRCESLAQVLSHFVVIWASTFDLKFESRVCSLPVSSLFLLLLCDFLLSGGRKGTPAVEGSELCLPRQRAAAAALEHPLGAWLVLSEHVWLRGLLYVFHKMDK